MINLTLLTAELSAKTVYFFQSCGADMGISPSNVLSRLLLKIPETTPRAAIERTMWYYDALTARKSNEEKLAILHVFSTLTLAMFGDGVMNPDIVKYMGDAAKEDYTPVDFTFNRKIKFAITNDAAAVLNQKMEEYKLSEGETIDRIVNDFTSQDSETIPYTLMNYLFVSAGNLINPQARLAVWLGHVYSIDRICEYSDCSTEEVKNKIQYMLERSYDNRNILDNINFIKEGKFYKEKFADSDTL